MRLFGRAKVIVFRMRKGWRGAWSVIGVVAMLLPGVPTTAAEPRAGRVAETAIKLTLEITWGDPALPALPPGVRNADDAGLDLEVGDGRVIEVRTGLDAPFSPKPKPDGSYRLGNGLSGKTRVRIETTAGSSLVARAGGAPTRFSIASLIEAPLRTAPSVSVPIQIERLAWDSLEVKLGPEGKSDGVFAPGSTIPMALGFNILVPEPGDVAVRYWAELRPVRGGEAVWVLPPRREVVATNATSPPGVILSVPAPKVDGSYVLEVHAAWEPAGAAEGSRLARLFKRRRKDSPVNVTRRVSLAVVGAKEPPHAVAVGMDGVSDSIDLTRARAQRSTATGRGLAPGGRGSAWSVPEAALVEGSRRDRLRGWNPFAGVEGAVLAPANAKGLAWSAMPLRVGEPGRPHRLTLKVAEGSASDLGVALIATGGPGGPARVILDASASGSVPGASSWPVWPDSEEVVLVLVNRSETSTLKLSSVELRALTDDPLPADLRETHPDSQRPLALHLAGPGALDRFGWSVGGGPPDAWGASRHLSAYVEHCGASSVVLADGLSDRARRTSLDGQADEDSTGPDRLDLILRALARKKLSAVLEVRYDGSLAGLPAVDSAEALSRGLVRLDRQGKADGLAYQPLRAEVREAMIARAVTAIGPRSKHPNLLGLVIRLGPGATLPGSPEVGLDDSTYPAFVRSAFQAEALAKVPGLDASDPKRFALRWGFVTGLGHEDWIEWRASRIGALYGEIDSAVRKASPGAVLAVATPGLDDGPAGVEAARAERASIAPLLAWKAVGLDLAKWPTGPVVLRGVGLSANDLAHDLATSPDLDSAVAARPGRGLWLGASEAHIVSHPAPMLIARPIADGPAGDEPLGHALAVLDARWIVVSGAAAAGQEDRLARFAKVYRALPNPPTTEPPSPRLDSGVAIRTWEVGGKTYVAMANDTPYTVLMESILHDSHDAEVDDLGRGQRLAPVAAPGGGKSLVLELPPFGAAALRVATAGAKVAPVAPYLPASRELDAQREKLSARLEAMADGGLSGGPKNAGFEDDGKPRVIPVSEVRTARPSTPTLKPPGWSVEGEGPSLIEIDTTAPHTGHAAMRLDAKAAGASALCDPFIPPGRSTLAVRAAIKADRPKTAVRVWLEGESAGKPFRWHADGEAGTEWSDVRLAVPNLPQGGLDRVRIRFERVSAGPLWVDDVSVTGDGASDSAKRAQLVLTAALHAYREKRYADFARFAGSHWVRQIEPDGFDAERSSSVRAAGSPTDLPSGRRLR